MGMFDIFGRNNPEANERNERNVLNVTEENNKQPLAIFKPTSYNDIAKIIDALKEGKSTVVHLNELKQETALRVLDIVSGAVYALNGGVYEMEKNVYMFSPTGVEISK